MNRIKISSPDLTALLTERLRTFPECPDGLLIAVVPGDTSESGWSAVMNSKQRKRHPRCAKRIQTIEKQLRKSYVLAED